VATCPSREQFLRLLQGSLEDREERLLEAHLKSCPGCVKTLEELTAVSPQEFREAGLRSLPPLSGHRTDPGSGTATAGHPPSTEFLLRLQERLRSATTPAKVTPEESRAGAAGEGLPRIDGYRVLGVLGRGGMGVVYKAEQLALRRLVALKMIRGVFVAETGSRSRFRTEVMAIAQLQHPHIVQIFEVGEAEDLPYYALEYVEGGSLADKLTGVPQPPGQAAELVERVARAVHFAHEHGIIHRDLKPGNILLTAEGTPKIADFGLAKQLDGTAGQSRMGEVLGTPSYMAPEQLSPTASGTQQPLGPACDVYALGAILYELLTGRQLYTGDTPLNVLVRVLHEDPTPPRAYRPELPRDVETICLKCLAKAPGDRYASARDLADDLHRFLIGEPVRARPPSLLYRSGKFVRRHKPLVGAAAGIALALTAGIVATSLTALSEAHQRRLADQNAYQAEVARQEAVREAYQARMAAALAALGDHNVREAAEQLGAVPEDRRGWEWRYAAARLDDSSTVLRDIGRGPFRVRRGRVSPRSPTRAFVCGTFLAAGGAPPSPARWPMASAW
jgi:hypothetical protein